MSELGGRDGDDGGPAVPDTAAASNGGVVAPAGTDTGAETELGPAVDEPVAGAAATGGAGVELVGVAEDTCAASSDADETGAAIASKPTATRVVRCVTTLRF